MALNDILTSMDGARDALVTAINAKGGNLAEDATLHQCADAVGNLFGDSSGTAEYYKCADIDTENKMWSGYKAVLSDGAYSFEETVTTGLTYSGMVPVGKGIYNADATVKVAWLQLSEILNDASVKFLLCPRTSGSLNDVAAGGNNVTVENLGEVTIGENGEIILGSGKGLTIPANTLPEDVFVSGSPFLIEFQCIVPTDTEKDCCSFAGASGTTSSDRFDMLIKTVEGESDYGKITIGDWGGSTWGGTFTTGSQHVIAFEYDGNNTNRIYLDGVLHTSFTGTSYLPFRTLDFHIGNDYENVGNANENPFYGRMAYFRIRNVAPYQGMSYTPEFLAIAEASGGDEPEPEIPVNETLDPSYRGELALAITDGAGNVMNPVTLTYDSAHSWWDTGSTGICYCGINCCGRIILMFSNNAWRTFCMTSDSSDGYCWAGEGAELLLGANLIDSLTWSYNNGTANQPLSVVITKVV